jgi:hypothetical protein
MVPHRMSVWGKEHVVCIVTALVPQTQVVSMAPSLVIYNATKVATTLALCCCIAVCVFVTTPKDVKPGKTRVIKCLMENMAQPNFGEECRAELAKREKVVKNDYRCVWVWVSVRV